MSGTLERNIAEKSWRKVNREDKLLKKQRKQEKLLKKLENNKKLLETCGDVEQNGNKELIKHPLSTLSIAVPSSILENAQSAELRTYLAGQIARAACIFNVDEIVVFDDVGIAGINQIRNVNTDNNEVQEKVRHSCLQLARILQYLECPQYLRKFFFPLHKDLQYSGLLNPLDAPHHLRQENIFMYREGVVTEKKVKNDMGSYINVGLFNDVLTDTPLTAGVRVTVKLNTPKDVKSKKLRGKIVSPTEPRLETGVYWGYTVRIAKTISDIFTQSPYKGGYDLTIGTSDKADNIHDVPSDSLKHNHAIIVFGGLRGLECALDYDEKLNVDDPKMLFDHYLNMVPNQGSRTIRTEEALLISLAAIQEKLKPNVKAPEFSYKECIPQSENTGLKQFEQINANNNIVNNDLSRFD